MTINPLEPHQLHHPCDPRQFGFQTTAELDDLTEIIGQMRAMDAVHFGADIRHDGYNLFVLGPAGLGKRTIVRQFLEKRAGGEQEHDDWCYINNFAEPHKPQTLRLPTGRGGELRIQMQQLVDYLRATVPGLFENDEYRAKAEAIQEEFSKKQEKVFKELGSDAEKQDVVLLRTPGGFAFAPARNQEVLPPDEYQKLPDSKMPLLYDVSHNTCKEEVHRLGELERRLFVHRKGATRAFGPGHPDLPPEFATSGQPVIIGGSMGTFSYILAGAGGVDERAFSSACHGAGRAMSRHTAMRQFHGREMVDELAARGIIIRSASMRGVAEEAPLAYKDVNEVVESAERAGLARKVAMLEPMICVKG